MVKHRNVSDSSLGNFKHALFTTNWDNLGKSLYNEYSNVAYTMFLDKFYSLLDEHIPEQSVKLNKYKHKKHFWITQAILKSIHTLDYLCKNAFTHKGLNI